LDIEQDQFGSDIPYIVDIACNSGIAEIEVVPMEVGLPGPYTSDHNVTKVKK
jgi:hypothetical protein